MLTAPVVLASEVLRSEATASQQIGFLSLRATDLVIAARDGCSVVLDFWMWARAAHKVGVFVPFASDWATCRAGQLL